MLSLYCTPGFGLDSYIFVSTTYSNPFRLRSLVIYPACSKMEEQPHVEAVVWNYIPGPKSYNNGAFLDMTTTSVS